MKRKYTKPVAVPKDQPARKWSFGKVDFSIEARARLKA
jgi:hypothetical protein